MRRRGTAHQVGVLDPPVVVLVRDDVGPLVGVHTQIEELRDTHAIERLVPHLKAAWLLHLAEDALPVIVPEGDQHSIVMLEASKAIVKRAFSFVCGTALMPIGPRCICKPHHGHFRDARKQGSSCRPRPPSLATGSQGGRASGLNSVGSQKAHRYRRQATPPASRSASAGPLLPTIRDRPRVYQSGGCGLNSHLSVGIYMPFCLVISIFHI